MQTLASTARRVAPPRRRRAGAAALSVLLGGGILFALLGPVAAGAGDRKGWSVATDPRKRAFLTWVPVADGPRVLTLACLRDVDTFTVLAENVAGRPGPATLTVSNGKARFDAAGEIAPDPVAEHPGFSADLPGDRKALHDIAGRLLPVLEGGGPILLQIDVGAAGTAGAKIVIPVAGLERPLARFTSICFGR